MWRWTRRVILLTIPLLLVLGAVGFMSARGVFIASLPSVRGSLKVSGLSSRADISRDGAGVVTVSGASFEDVCFAEGFVHAQERFAQMDSLRRYAAGRLAEMFGASALELDKRMRPNEFERRADELLRRLPERHRAALRAYALGVNEGVRLLGAPPPEHALLRAAVRPWLERDALLVQYAMWDTLAMDRGFELMTGTMLQALPGPLVRFLTTERTRWDRPLLGGRDPEPWALPIPGPEVINIREPSGGSPPSPDSPSSPTARAGPYRRLDTDGDAPVGSNSFAVAGDRSVHGGAILANDMHLPLKVPAMWFRVRLVWGDRRLDGMSLPGVPGIVVGSNSRLAWGFTNVGGDFEDWILIETDTANPDRYKTPEGSEEFGHVVYQIGVGGPWGDTGASIRLDLRTTRWGPVTRTDVKGRPLVPRWTAHDVERTNINLLDLFTARTLEEGVEAARSWFGPPQNVLIASDQGRIAWVVSGSIPVRTGVDGRSPASWAAPGTGWTGWLDEKERPLVIDPPGGALWTANNRTLSPERAEGIGHAWANAGRAARIGDLLGGRARHSEGDLLAIQLDTRDAQYDFYKALALEACAAADDPSPFQHVEPVLAGWNGRADTDQAGFALLKKFRARLRSAVFGPLTAPCLILDPTFRYRWFNEEEPLRRLLEARPLHLLSSRYADWASLIRACLFEAVNELKDSPPRKGPATTWGELNRAAIEHPLSGALGWIPGMDRLLNMPPDPLPGDVNTVRVSTPSFGASQRLVVSPGREESGIAELPCGQSGHPLSVHYRDMQGAWVRGEATPLAPGAAVSILTLEPARPDAGPRTGAE